MKQKLLLLLALLSFSLGTIAQETAPAVGANFKQLSTSQFYINLPDSAIWQYKGTPYGWHRLAKYKDLATATGGGGATKTYIDSLLTANYESKTTATNKYYLKSGGTLTGGVTLPASISVQVGGTRGALNLNNSDVIGMNAIFMADAANSASEGIMWPKTTSANLDLDVWDNLKGYNGELQWTGINGADFKGNIKTTGKLYTGLSAGIGTATSDIDMLSVGGNIRTSTALFVTGGGSLYSPSANKLALSVASADRFILDNGGLANIPGKVRIGDQALTFPTNIDNKLFISGAGAGPSGRTGIILQNTDSTSAAQLRIANDKGQFFIMQTSGAGYQVGNGANSSASISSNLDMTFDADADVQNGGQHDIYFKVGGYDDANTALSIITGKKVGINNMLPTQTLDVNGTVKSSSLSGTGSRMVVADATGLLSTQAIPSGGGGGTGTVTSVSSANADITVAAGTTTPVLTLNKTFSITGNASTATTLATARTINGVAFNGSANILVADDNKVPLVGGNMTGQLNVAYGTTTMNQIKVQSASGGLDETSGIGLQNRVGVMYDGTYKALKFHTIDNTKPIIFANDFTIGAGEYARFSGDGRLGINNAAPAEKLDVVGNIKVAGSVSASGGLFDTSDIRLKNVVDSTFDVKALKPIAFTWKSDNSAKPAVHYGYSAQEVQKVMPNAIKVQSDGTLTVNYIEVLVAKIKELEDRIKTLEAKEAK